MWLRPPLKNVEKGIMTAASAVFKAAENDQGSEVMLIVTHSPSGLPLSMM